MHIKEFDPYRVVFSDGTVLTTTKGREFDQDILEKILKYDDRDSSELIDKPKEHNEGREF